MGLIEIEGMEFHAYHGHFDVEQVVGNRFLVDVAIETDCKAAGETDDLNSALDYQIVYRTVQQEMNKASNLLEHVCTRILDALYKNVNGIQHAKVKVSKMNPPMGGQIQKVSLTMSK